MITREQFHDDVAFWNASVKFTSEFVVKLNASPKIDAASRVLRYFLDRATETGKIFLTLAAHHGGHAYTNDALTLLRTMYDVSLQAMWLTNDLSNTATLAEDYLAFAEIERHTLLEKLASSETEFAKQIMKSPRRSAAEADIENAFRKAAARFQGKKAGFPANWYRCNLRQIAQNLNLVEEYDFMVAQFSKAVHATPSNMRDGPGMPQKDVISRAWEFLLRVMDANARHHRLELSPELKEVFEYARINAVRVMTIGEKTGGSGDTRR